MSNINVTDICSSLQFLGNFVVENVEMMSGNELCGKVRIRVLIDNKQHELRVEMKMKKKEGIGLLVREDGTLFMKMMFVNDECEGEVIKKDDYGNIVLKGRVEKGKEVGIWIEYNEMEKEIWRGFYRKGKRHRTMREQEGI